MLTTCYTPLMDNYVAMCKQILLEQLADTDIAVYLFGSRAKGTERPTSDIDIALDAKGPVPALVYDKVLHALEHSVIPYKFDVIDMHQISADFKNIILKEGIQWKGYNKNST